MNESREGNEVETKELRPLRPSLVSFNKMLHPKEDKNVRRQSEHQGRR